jgi:hypothetical protein
MPFKASRHARRWMPLVFVGAVCVVSVQVLRAEQIKGDAASLASADPRNMKNCGPACLYACLALHGHAVSYGDALEGVKISSDGTSFEALRKQSRKLDVNAEIVRCTYEEIRDYLPAIVHLDVGDGGQGHFVVLLGSDEREMYLLDTTVAEVIPISYNRFFNYWTGVALVFLEPSYMTVVTWSLVIVFTMLVLTIITLLVWPVRPKARDEQSCDGGLDAIS